MTERRDSVPDACAEALERIDELLDGELDATTARRLLDHLEACPPCGSEGEVYRELKTAVAGCGNGVDPSTLERLRRFATRLTSGEEPPS